MMESHQPAKEILSHLESLIQEVKQLKIKYLELLDENRYLKIQLEEKEVEIRNQKNFIQNLENQYKVRNLATQTVLSENQQKYIEDLLKEINACLGLLEIT